jgi:hypothetical protein
MDGPGADRNWPAPGTLGGCQATTSLSIGVDLPSPQKPTLATTPGGRLGGWGGMLMCRRGSAGWCGARLTQTADRTLLADPKATVSGLPSGERLPGHDSAGAEEQE